MCEGMTERARYGCGDGLGVGAGLEVGDGVPVGEDDGVGDGESVTVGVGVGVGDGELGDRYFRENQPHTSRESSAPKEEPMDSVFACSDM